MMDPATQRPSKALRFLVAEPSKMATSGLWSPQRLLLFKIFPRSFSREAAGALLRREQPTDDSDDDDASDQSFDQLFGSIDSHSWSRSSKDASH